MNVYLRFTFKKEFLKINTDADGHFSKKIKLLFDRIIKLKLINAHIGGGKLDHKAGGNKKKFRNTEREEWGRNIVTEDNNQFRDFEFTRWSAFEMGEPCI